MSSPHSHWKSHRAHPEGMLASPAAARTTGLTHKKHSWDPSSATCRLSGLRQDSDHQEMVSLTSHWGRTALKEVCRAWQTCSGRHRLPSPRDSTLPLTEGGGPAQWVPTVPGERTDGAAGLLFEFHRDGWPGDTGRTGRLERGQR